MTARIKVLENSTSFLEASVAVQSNLSDLPENINKVQNLWINEYAKPVNSIEITLTP